MLAGVTSSADYFELDTPIAGIESIGKNEPYSRRRLAATIRRSAAIDGHAITLKSDHLLAFSLRTAHLTDNDGYIILSPILKISHGN